MVKKKDELSGQYFSYEGLEKRIQRFCHYHVNSVDED